MASTWLSDNTANRLHNTYINGFLDISDNNAGNTILRNGKIIFKPNDHRYDFPSTSFKHAILNNRSEIDVPYRLNFNVNGTNVANITKHGFSATAKHFVIPHPIISNKNLRHSNIETPQLKNMYVGHSQLHNGIIHINLDTYFNMTHGTFQAINKEAYTITTNESDFSAVKGNVIDGNILHIECEDNTSNIEVSWIVFAIRNDNAINNTDIIDDAGKYITEYSTI